MVDLVFRMIPKSPSRSLPESPYAEAYEILVEEDGTVRELDEAKQAHDRIGLGSESWE